MILIPDKDVFVSFRFVGFRNRTRLRRTSMVPSPVIMALTRSVSVLTRNASSTTKRRSS